MVKTADVAPPPGAPRWMVVTLGLAAAYNLLWGGAVVLAPGATLELIGLDGESTQSRVLWGCIGMIVGVYGIGYAAAAMDPLRHWPIVLVGFLGKVLGPIGFVMAYTAGDVPARMGWTILTNDLVWWVPFGLILWRAFERRGRRRVEGGAVEPASGGGGTLGA